MIDLMHALRDDSQANELSGLMLHDEDLLLGETAADGSLEEQADAMVLAMMMPSTLSEAEEAETNDDESELDSLWHACLADSEAGQTPRADSDNSTKGGGPSDAVLEPLDDLVSGELSEDAPDEMMMMLMEHDEHTVDASMHADAVFPAPLPPVAALTACCRSEATLAAGKKRRGRKPSSLKSKEKKPKRPPPSAAKARLRSYERRSRHKREHTMMTMKETVAALEMRIKALCDGGVKAEHPTQQRLSELAMEAMHLTNHNYNLRKALDDHRFFHSMLQLEYDHRETTADWREQGLDDVEAPRAWRPMEEAVCLRFMRDSFLEIEEFSNSEDFVSSGLEICGWREKRKLVGNSVNFMFHKTFAKDCSEDLAARSWEMRAVQDQVTRYFGHSLEVQVEVLQRFENDVVVVRRRIKHTVDGWVHKTIYLLFRTKTPDGHLVCIRDMNPEDQEDYNVMTGKSVPPSQCVIWSKAFIWWKFTTLPEVEGQRIRGFEVEYGGSLGAATEADAAFWMREVLVLALRWENLVVGPLLTL